MSRKKKHVETFDVIKKNPEAMAIFVKTVWGKFPRERKRVTFCRQLGEDKGKRKKEKIEENDLLQDDCASWILQEDGLIAKDQGGKEKGGCLG